MGNDIERYCFVCKTKHSLEAWRWRKSSQGYYCPKGIDCIGCQMIHLNETGFTRMDARGAVCGKWARSAPPTPEQKAKNMSPEEVMAGVPYGGEMPSYFKGKSSNNFTEERSKALKELESDLSG